MRPFQLGCFEVARIEHAVDNRNIANLEKALDTGLVLPVHEGHLGGGEKRRKLVAIRLRPSQAGHDMGNLSRSGQVISNVQGGGNTQ